MKDITDIIRNRRSIYPPSFNDKAISREILEEILENANWAPNHKKTEPWRFKVLQGEALKRLSQYMGDYYINNTPPEKFKPKKQKNSSKSPTIIGRYRHYHAARCRIACTRMGGSRSDCHGRSEYVAHLYSTQYWLLLELSKVTNH